VQPGCHALAERARNAAFEAAHAEIAEVRLAARFGREARLRGDHRDQAGRGVAAEQGTLRAAQHLDAVQRPELGKTDPGARAVDAVDEQADRAFEARIVADRADAADTRDRRAGFRRGR